MWRLTVQGGTARGAVVAVRSLRRLARTVQDAQVATAPERGVVITGPDGAALARLATWYLDTFPAPAALVLELIPTPE